MADVLPAGKQPALRVMPMPADANQNGDIFGGWIMAQVDVAGGTVAGKIARGRVATVAVKDLARAREFYEGKLGLTPLPGEEKEVVAYKCGSSKMFVYTSQYAGTNRATAATWMAGDRVESLVRSLKDKGVTFEHYDMPNMKRDGDIHVSGNMKVAWFKDPDGNILNIVKH